MNDQPLAPPTRALTKSLKECQNLGEAFQSGEFLERVKQGLPTHLNPNAMLRTYIQAVQKSPLIMKVETRQAIGAFLTLSQLGLMPNNALGEAFLIPFARNKWNPATRQRELQGYDLNVVIGYKGYLALAFRSGLVGAIHSDVVYETDEFEYVYGTEQTLRHRPTGKQDDNATPGYVYAVAHLTGSAAGVPPFRVMPWAQILRTRNRSQGYQSALASKQKAEEKGWKLPAGYTDAPWVKHVIPMAMKTAFLRLSTWIPRSIEIAGAQALDDAGDRGARVDFAGVLDGSSVVDQTIEIQDEDPEADSGFGTRSHDDEPSQIAQSGPENRQTPAQTQHQQPANTQHSTATQTRADFSGYLCTDTGEMAEINDGHFRDPIAWADAYIGLWDTSQDHDTLRENNEETLGDIFDHHPDAQAMLDAATKPKAQAPRAATKPAAAPPADLVQMPMKGNRMDLMGYIARVRAALADLDGEHLHTWRRINSTGPLFDKLPSVTKRALQAAIDARLLELNPPAADPTVKKSLTVESEEPPPPTAQDTPGGDDPDDLDGPGLEQTAPDNERAIILESDRAWVLAIAEDIGKTKNQHELEALARNPAIVARRRLIGTRHPELLTQLTKIADEHAAKFGNR